MTQQTVRLTVAQAVVRFLANQWSERDGERQKLFAGCFGIFGHGNVAGIGQALLQNELEADEADRLPYVLARNRAGRCTPGGLRPPEGPAPGLGLHQASVGPGSTNMLTGAAFATIDRLPVLLLPAGTFAIGVPRRCSRARASEPRMSPSTTPSGPCPGASTGSTGPSSCPPPCWARCGSSLTRSRPAR